MYHRHSKYALFRFCIKVNDTEATFSKFASIGEKFNKGIFYKCCIVDPTSCQCELSTGITNGAHNAPLSQAQTEEVTMVSSEVTFEDTNRSETPSWAKSLLLCEKERIAMTATP